MISVPCVVRRERDALTTEEWKFCVVGEQIVLDGYGYWTRPTKRHKPHVVKEYDRLNRRHSSMVLAEVPFPDDVAAEALTQVTSRFRVVRELQR